MPNPPEFADIARAEMKPDMYAGDECDRAEPRWDAWFFSDMEGEHSPDALTFDPRVFAPGTRITISSPKCPTCEMDAPFVVDGRMAPCTECGYDWQAWMEAEYS